MNRTLPLLVLFVCKATIFSSELALPDVPDVAEAERLSHVVDKFEQYETAQKRARIRLMQAIKDDDEAQVSELLAEGANPNFVQPFQTCVGSGTPLTYAVYINNHKLVNAILTHKGRYKAEIDHNLSERLTLTCRFDRDYIDRRFARTDFCAAVHCADLDVVKLLHVHGAKLDRQILVAAGKVEKVEILEYIAANGDFSDADYNFALTAVMPEWLDHVYVAKRLPIIKLLTEKCIKLSDLSGKLALRSAIICRDGAFVKKLISHNLVDIDCIYDDKDHKYSYSGQYTPLALARYIGFKDMEKILLDFGARESVLICAIL